MNESCGYVDTGNEKEPLCSSLQAPREDELTGFGNTAGESSKGGGLKDMTNQFLPLTVETDEEKNEPQAKKSVWEQGTILNVDSTTLPTLAKEVIPVKALPHCPKCDSLLRPGAVLLGEALDKKVLNEITD